jgi:hypothetical protein
MNTDNFINISKFILLAVVNINNGHALEKSKDFENRTNKISLEYKMKIIELMENLPEIHKKIKISAIDKPQKELETLIDICSSLKILPKEKEEQIKRILAEVENAEIPQQYKDVLEDLKFMKESVKAINKKQIRESINLNIKRAEEVLKTQLDLLNKEKKIFVEKIIYLQKTTIPSNNSTSDSENDIKSPKNNISPSSCLKNIIIITGVTICLVGNKKT